GDTGKERRKLLLALQVAEAGRVRRGDVDRQIVGERRKHADARDIVRGAVVAVAIGADIDAEDASGLAPVEALGEGLVTLIIEAQAVDERAVARQPEKPRQRIARLGERRDGADFDEAEAEAEELVGDGAVLVEAGGKTDRIGQ